MGFTTRMPHINTARIGNTHTHTHTGEREREKEILVARVTLWIFPI